MASEKSVLCLRVISIKSYLEKRKEAQLLILLASTGKLCEADAIIVDISSALHLLVLALVTKSTASVV